MKNIGPIRVILFDVDGAIMPDSGPIDWEILQLFHRLRQLGLPMGPCSGRPFDYLKALGVCFGKHFPFLSAENGAVWAILESEQPPKWRVNLTHGQGIADLIKLEQILHYERRMGQLQLAGKTIAILDQAKMGELSMFTRTTPVHNLASPIEDLISENHLNLKVIKFPDGSLTISPLGSHKGLAVDQACELYQCQRSEVLVVIDGKNDAELAEGTTCIAVGNAHQDIKTIVCARNDFGFVAIREHGFGFAEGLAHFAREGRLPSEVISIVDSCVPSALS